MTRAACTQLRATSHTRRTIARGIRPPPARVVAPMPRSKLDTLIHATILLTPMLVAAGYVALAPVPAPVVVFEPAAACPEPAALADLCEPEPAPEPAPEPEPIPEPAPMTDAPTSLAGAGMLLHDHQLVLTTTPDLTWSKGQLRNHAIGWGVAVSKRVDATRLPDPLRALTDARVVVYAADGSTCTATTHADDLTIYGRQDGELAYPEDDNDELTPAQLREVREQVFADAQLLRARLHRDDARRCEGLWARDAALPSPTVFAAALLDEHDRTLHTRVLAQLADIPAVAEFAGAYRRYGVDSGGEQPTWSTFQRDTLQLTRWDELGGARSYLNVIVGDGGEPCSGLFYDQLALLFAIEGETLRLLDQPGFLHPLAVMDLERDGLLEAVTAGGTQLESRGAATPTQRYEFPYHGCPC